MPARVLYRTLSWSRTAVSASIAVAFANDPASSARNPGIFSASARALQRQVHVRPPVADRLADRFGPAEVARPDDHVDADRREAGGQAAPGRAGRAEDADGSGTHGPTDSHAATAVVRSGRPWR